MKTMTYRPIVGDRISHSVQEASRLSKTHRCRVRFEFNEVTLQATPKKSPVTLLWEWELICGQHYEQYRLSKAGQVARRLRNGEVATRRENVASLIARLPRLLAAGDVDGLMLWLDLFVDSADDVDVHFDCAELARTLEASGFIENDLVGQPPASFNTREKVGRYIVGQAINCLRSGMPPHLLTQSFVAKYFEIPT